MSNNKIDYLGTFIEDFRAFEFILKEESAK